MKNLILMFIVLFLASPSFASRSTPKNYASGTIAFYQNQGNYCDETRNDCYGAKYIKQDHYNRFDPVRYAKVVAVRRSDGVIIGQGSTDGVGEYNFTWSGSADVSASIQVHLEHKDGRFIITNNNGASFAFAANTTLRAKTTSGITMLIGNSSSPNPLLNLYDGAQKEWENALRYSNRMLTHFTNVEIEAFDANECPTSCAKTGKKIVIDSEGSAFMPQHRIMHEMGHIASTLSSRNQVRASTTYYKYDGNDGWSLTSAEYGAPQFEEALATHFADAALYYPWAKSPATCLTAGRCAPNLEESILYCDSDESRQPIQVMRFLWDNYDSRNEEYFGPGFPRDTLYEPLYEVNDTLYSFDPGNGNGQRDEPSSSDKDGRSGWDYAKNSNKRGIEASMNISINCALVGD